MISSKEHWIVLLWVILAIVFVCLLWLGSWFWIDHTFPGSSLEIFSKRAQFADKFGAINSLFAGLAFAGIIISILLQKQELSLQRQELAETRGELAIQNLTLKLQRFENTLFHLIDLHHKILEGLSLEKPDHGSFRPMEFKGASFINKARTILGETANGALLQAYQNQEDTKNVVIDSYNEFEVIIGNKMNHYFRNLYHIFKYIHTSELVDPEKRNFYSSIVSSQLSTDELVIIFYNMLMEGYGYPNFKYLDQEYDILHNLRADQLFNEDHMNLFNEMIAENPF